MSRVIESMTKIRLGGGLNAYSMTMEPVYVIRIWRNEETVQFNYQNQDLIAEAVELFSAYCYFPDQIADRLSRMPRVNAVELTEENSGRGILIYPEWP